MVNGLGVLGWGVGGIEAEAAMLGQPLSMLLPPVVGLRISGRDSSPGITATDVVLTVTELLRDHGVVGAFVECFGPGVAALPLETRATIGNMSPEYGATCTMFPIDEVTLDYLALHRPRRRASRPGRGVRQGPGPLARSRRDRAGLLRAPRAGPGRCRAVARRPGPAPGQGGPGTRARDSFRVAIDRAPATAATAPAAAPHHQMTDGDVVIAAITSCTNTSNPQVMVAAGLLAKKAIERGLRAKPWVKTSLAPGSRVVMDYLERAGLTGPLEELGFFLVGFGCTTCIGNSGPLLEGVSEAVKEGDLSVAAVLSGNRNFEGQDPPRRPAQLPGVTASRRGVRTGGDDGRRPDQRAHRRATPMATRSCCRSIWPPMDEVNETIRASLTSDMFRTRYAAVFDGDEYWRQVTVAEGETYAWQDDVHVREEPALLRVDDDDAGTRHRHRGRAGARDGG